MLKRMNKITALLIAAATVTSLVPAMAASTSIQKLETKDGNIESAIAYKDGKYTYQGYKDDEDDGIYYNSGKEDKYLDEIEDADLNGAYSDKYAYAKDGNDEYLVDLTNGDVTDDITPEDDSDNAKTKLRSNLKRTDRYGQITESAVSLTKVTKGGKFADTWYSYEVTPLSSADGKDYTLNGKLFGFTNKSGKYIDISTTANIYAYSSTKGKFVKIEDFTNDYTDVDDDTKLSAVLVKAPEVLAQDKDYFYVKTTVNIYDKTAATGDLTGGTTTAASATVTAGTSSVFTTRTYIQKISKEQGDKKDDAYLPKSVASYELTKGELDSGDANDAFDAVNAADDFSVVDGKLLAIDKTTDNVKVTSINLKKDKVEYKVTKPTSFTSSKVDAYLAEKDDSDDVDVDDEGNAYDIDVDGNVWVVAKGKIYEFKNNEMTKIYACDSSLNNINVYDKDNLITWEEDGDIYTTVADKNGSSSEEDKPEEKKEEPAVKTGWDQLQDGTWNFYDTTGKKVVSNWVNVGGVWYYLKADGVMATGWLNDNGTWYYLKSSGAMATGWLYDGAWYYLKSSGAMATGWIYDNGAWYYLKSSGAMATGWVYDGSNWYYLYSNGSMAHNTVVDGYRLSSSGAWV